MTVSQVRASEGLSRRGSDPLTWYLASIGREPLLTASEEIELGNQVQAMMHLVEERREDYSPHERKIIKISIKLTKMPRGVETSPIAVANPRSLSPNQLLANLDTGFFKNAWLHAHTMCPKNHSHIEV
jgi:hypothetical protein